MSTEPPAASPSLPPTAPPTAPAGAGSPVATAPAAAPPAAPKGGATPKEVGGPTGPDPTRFGDWERKGRCIDF